MNPIGKIKDVAVETLKVPAAVAGTAVGSAVGLAKSAATSLVGGNQAPEAPPVPTDVEPEPDAPEPAQDEQDEQDEVAEDEPHLDIDPDEPVNVTEELGLDPSPVAKPKPRKKAAPKPVTKIDAEADPSDVDVTPADIAERAGEHGPA